MRLSIEDKKGNVESTSIANQRAFIREYAKKNGIEIYDYYVDDGCSGGNFDRPEFKRLINDIEHGIINCVITKDMSRLGREFIETGNYVFKYFPEHNIRYIAILDNYDTLNPNGSEDMLPFKAVINDMYLKDISKKIKSVRHNMMKNGDFVSGTVPYGYKRASENSKKLVIDEYAAQIVVQIFEMKDYGKTDGMIARYLTDQGILPPDVYSGKKLKRTTITTNLWKPSTVKHLLQNENYIGTLIQGKYEKVSLKSKKKRLLPKSKWIIKKNAIPALISNDLFERVNSLKRKSDIRYRKYDYLLKGLVLCADCGCTMSVRRVKKQKDSDIVTPIYLCRTYAAYRNGVCSMHYYREEDLNDIILSKIRAILLKYYREEDLSKKYETVLGATDMMRKYTTSFLRAKSQIITIDKAISDLYKDKASGILSTEEFVGIKKELEKDRREYDAKISDLETLISESKRVLVDDKTKQKYIHDFLKVKNFNKEMIKMFVNKIEIKEDKTVKIFFHFSLDGGN